MPPTHNNDERQKVARRGGVRAAKLAHPPLQRRDPPRFREQPRGANEHMTCVVLLFQDLHVVTHVYTCLCADAREHQQPAPAGVLGAQHQVDSGAGGLHGQGHQARPELPVSAFACVGVRVCVGVLGLIVVKVAAALH